MSGFKRTLNGLNNQHLFYDVDFIVFVEGGSKSYNKEEVYAGNFNLDTADIIFWQNVFNKFTDIRKLKFKSIGSKSTIKEIALDIVEGNLRTIFVAMDNEFDEVLNNKIDHPNVYYTYGYSYENDVWTDVIIKEVIEELTAVEILHDDIQNNFSEFLKRIKLAVYADGYLFKKESSFFPRTTGYLFCVNCTPIYLPEIKREKIEERIASKNLSKNSLYSFGSRYSIEPNKHCYGHLLADYCCQTIIHYLRNRHTITNLPKDIIYRMGIRKFFQFHFDSGPVFNYYKQMFLSRLNLP